MVSGAWYWQSQKALKNKQFLVYKIETEKNPKELEKYIYQLTKFGDEGVKILKEIIKIANATDITDNNLLIDSILKILIKEKIITETDELFVQTRDFRRIKGLRFLKSAVRFYSNISEKPFNNCIAGKIYYSNKGTNAIDGNGWLPIDFRKSFLGGDPFITELNVDPKNIDEFVYRFSCNPKNFTFEFNAQFEFDENKETFSVNDGGNNPNIYEVGTDLNLIK